MHRNPTLPEPKLGWGPFIAAKLIEIACGLTGLIVFAVVFPADYIPMTAEAGILSIIGGAIFVSLMYFVYFGYLIVSIAIFGVSKLIIQSSKLMSAVLASVFGVHAAIVAVWADYLKPSFAFFIAVMAISSYLIHRYAFQKLA